MRKNDLKRETQPQPQASVGTAEEPWCTGKGDVAGRAPVITYSSSELAELFAPLELVLRREREREGE